MNDIAIQESILCACECVRAMCHPRSMCIQMCRVGLGNLPTATLPREPQAIGTVNSLDECENGFHMAPRLLLGNDNSRLLGSVDAVQELTDILVLDETLTVEVSCRL